MTTTVRHAVVDTNTIISYLHPVANESDRLSNRTSTIFGAAKDGNWPGLRIYTPSICIAEAIGVLDKYRYCTWRGEVKTKPKLRLTPAKYQKIRNLLETLVSQRTLDTIEGDPAHNALVGSISPINQHYQFRRTTPKTSRKAPPVKPPMGGADCLVAASAMLLGTRVGHNNVIILTNDQRMGDVMARGRSLSEARASTLGLIDAASKAGLRWKAEMYPNAISIRNDSDNALRTGLIGWPLPSAPITEARYADLDATQRQFLGHIWSLRKDRYNTSIDAISYTNAPQEIAAEFAVEFGIYLEPKEICHGLLNMRKAKNLPS